MNERAEDLSDAERARLAALRVGPQPPSTLEQRTLRALRAEGAFAAAAGLPRPGRTLTTAAALVLGVLVGFAWRRPAPAETSERRFLLLVHSTADPRARLDPEETERRVAEYGAWARGLGDGLLDAAKLRPRADSLRLVDGAPSVTPLAELRDAVGGYFLIQSDDRERALEIAATCPHLAHGRWLELREVER